MNRLNTTEYAIFTYLMYLLPPKDVTIQNLLNAPLLINKQRGETSAGPKGGGGAKGAHAPPK